MMSLWKRVSARERRTVAIGLGLMAATMGFGRGLPALRTWQDAHRGAAAEAAERLATAESSVAQRATIGAELHRQSARLRTLDSTLIAARTLAEAGAELSSIVHELGESAGLVVKALAIRPDSAFAGDFAPVAVRLSAVGDVFALATLLQTLEDDAMGLAVRELSVSAHAPGAPETQPEALQIDVLVEGLARRRR